MTGSLRCYLECVGEGVKTQTYVQSFMCNALTLYILCVEILWECIDSSLVHFKTGENELSGDDGQLRPQSSVSTRNVS